MDQQTLEPAKKKTTAEQDLAAKLEAQGKMIQELQSALLSKQAAQNGEGPEKVAKVMFFEGNPVVEFGNTRDAGGSLSIKLGVLQDDGTVKPVEADYLQVVNHGIRFLAEIIEEKKKVTTEHQGPIPMKVVTVMSDMVAKKTASGNPYRSRQIVLEHTPVETSAKVKFLEGPWVGREISMNARFLNP